MAKEFVPCPVAAQSEEDAIQVIALTAVDIIVAPRPVQVIPSELVAKVCVPAPPATNKAPFHAMAFPEVVKGDVRAAQMIPSGLVAIVFVPCPTAIQRARAETQMTALACVLKIVFPVLPTQRIPSELVAKEWLPSPPITY